MVKAGIAATALFLVLVQPGCSSEQVAGRTKPTYGSTATKDQPDPGVTDGGAQDVGLLPDAVAADVAVADAPDVAVADAQDIQSDTGPAPDVAVVPDVVGDGGIGSACNVDADCTDADAVCLDFPGGYCTVLGCVPGTGTCPGGSECHVIDDGLTACLATCTKSSDCRKEYPCKRLFKMDGTFSQVCHAVDKGAAGPAGICDYAKACSGTATCLTFLPGGYCAVVGCGPGVPCPLATSCIPMGDFNACLADCDGAHPCPGSAAKLQSCQGQLDLQGETRDVCLTGTSGKELGELCVSNVDCLSKSCTVLAEGRCAPGNGFCLTDADCAMSAGVCDIKAEYHVGVCSKACDVDTPCPEKSLCVPTSATAGLCQVQCKSLSDTYTCDDQLEQECVIGDPLGGELDADLYACVTRGKGKMGELCDNVPDGPTCAEGLTCYQGSGSEGYCTGDCGAKDFCPWSTVCGSAGAFDQCLRRCKADTDCPSGFECKLLPVTTKVNEKICVPS